MLVKLTQFPNEENASLTYGETEIKMSATFVHHLLGVLANGRVEGKSYSRDITELQLVLSRISNEMSRTARNQTPEQQKLLVKRYHEFGRVYWSSWMDEPCPW